MNRENAKDYLPLVQALAEGKAIEFKYVMGGWGEVDSLSFYHPVERYRIKAEPREIWVNEWKPSGKVVFDSPQEADEHAKRYGIRHVIKRYREVIE